MVTLQSIVWVGFRKGEGFTWDTVRGDPSAKTSPMKSDPACGNAPVHVSTLLER